MTLADGMLWGGFTLFILAMLALDLFVFHRKPHEIKFKEALMWSGVWIGLALLFNAASACWQGTGASIPYRIPDRKITER